MDQATLNAVRESARKLLQEKLVPLIEKSEEDARFCKEVLEAMGEMGLAGPMLPEAYGGADDLWSQFVITEEMGYFCGAFGMSTLVSVALFGGNIARHGSEEQKRKYLPLIASGKKLGCWALTEPQVGSDALAVQTRCYRQGDQYTINGSKTFITNAPVADYFLIITREVDQAGQPLGKGIEGGTAFLLERGMNGLSTGKPFKKMGHLSSPTGEVFMKDVKVPASQVLGKPGRAFYDMKHSLDIERIIFSGLALGMMKFCLDKTLEYTLSRQQFGQPIAHFQMIQEKIARMVTAYESSRTYTHAALEKMARGEDLNREAAITKLLTSEALKVVCDEAVQCHGGYGYMREYQVERYLRDAKLFEIGAGTSEIQKMIIAKQALKEHRSN